MLASEPTVRRHPPGTGPRRPRRGPSGGVLLLFLTLLAPPALVAQPSTFGSADDPREDLQTVWWRREHALDVLGGPSLIAAQWRAAGSVAFQYVSRPLTARFASTVRAGLLGAYTPDIDEPYDVLRLVDFVRYDPPPQSPLYLRLGVVERMRLGYGHLVNFFSTRAAWDERTVGLEGQWRGPLVEVGAFTDNVLLDGVMGARVGLTPLYAVTSTRLRSVRVGVSYVTDRRPPASGAAPLDAFSVDAAFDVLGAGEITLSPFTSFATYTHYGSGVGFGADVESLNFIDLARFRLRLALFYNSARFTPGYVGAFYPVSNPAARIVNSDDFLDGDPEQALEGVALGSARGGNALVTELRVLFFERFEFWYYFQRHYGSQALSEYHLRFFVRVPDRIRLDVGMDRGGLRSIFTLLNDLGDQTALVFNTEYRVAANIWLHIRARYSYEKIGVMPSGEARYLVQRRFEPLAGLRIRL